MREKPSADGGGTVGRLFQAWRRKRGLSQLTLALEAGVSARHLSFIESGRSNPSREMVLLLAEALDVPYRERNDLLTAAGFAQHYRETGLSTPELAAARQAIELILRHQEPFPAVVMDRHWNLVLANPPAQRLFARLLEGRNLPGPPNVIRTMFHPDGVRRWVANWEAVAGVLLERIHRESLGGAPDPATQRLLAEALAHAGLSAKTLRASAAAPASALIPVQFRQGDLALDFFSTVTTLGTPRDVTLQEIRVECFFPADDRTSRQAVRWLAAAPG